MDNPGKITRTVLAQSGGETVIPRAQLSASMGNVCADQHLVVCLMPASIVREHSGIHNGHGIKPCALLVRCGQKKFEGSNVV